MTGDNESAIDTNTIVSFSLNDENSPIRAQNTVDRFVSLIAEDDSDNDPDDDEEDDEKSKSDNEPEKESRMDRVKYNRSRRRRNVLNTDHLAMTTHSRKNQNDSITHPFGHKRDLINPLRGLDLTEENFVDIFLDQKISQNGKMTAEMRSTLKSLEKRINIPRRGILKENDDNES